MIEGDTRMVREITKRVFSPSLSQTNKYLVHVPLKVND